MKAPSFQFYPSDFMLSTVGWTQEERGAYITGLCIQWSEGSLPIDQNEFCRLLGLVKGTSSALKVVKKFPAFSRSKRANGRLESVRKKQVEWLERCRKGGLNSWRKRSKGTSSELEDHFNSPTPTPSNKEVKTLSYQQEVALLRKKSEQGK